MTFLAILFLTALFLGTVALSLRAAVIGAVEKVFAQRDAEAVEHMKTAAEEAQAAVDAMNEEDDEDEEDEDEEDVCLQPGARVRCNLSDCTHTHGVLIGFTMNPHPGGPMLALVSLGPGLPVLPIDVDRVDPDGVDGDEGGGIPLGYRDSVKPKSNSNWN